VTFGRWLLGVAVLATIAIALAVGARAIRRRFAPELDGPTALLADTIVAVSGLVVLAEALGVVGLLDVVPLLVGAVAVGAAGVAVGRRADLARGGEQRGGHEEARGVALTWVSFAGAGLVFAAWVRRTLVSLDFGVGGVDSLWYHLPFAAKFAQDGSVTAVPYVDLEFLTAFYPANVELLHAVGMVAFGTAALSPLLSLAALALALLAGWCVGRPFGVAPATLLATAVVVGVPALYETQAGEAKNDIAALAFLLAAAALLVASRPRPATLALAGAAAGLALGTKLSFLAPVAALGVAAVWLARRDARAKGSGAPAAAAGFAAAAAATGGYWYLRNLFATGNPLPWLGPLPQPAEARSADTTTSLAEYLTDFDAWDRYFLPGLHDVVGPAWPLLIAGAAVGIALAIARGNAAVRWVGIVALVAAVAYVVTPSSAAGPPGEPEGFALNVRYALPAVLLGLTLLPIVLRRRSQAILVAGLAVVLLITQLAPDAIWDDLHRKKALAVGVAGLGAAAVLARLGGRRRAGVLAAATLAALAILWPLERDFLKQQYTATHPPYTSWNAFDMQPAYDWARGRHGARIAVTGTTGSFFQFPLHGPTLDNEVDLIGEHGPHGSFTPATRCGDLVRELASHTHVVVTPYLDVWDPFHPGDAPELACLRMTGAREVLASGPVHVFALEP
jgi:hypothetical protein